MSWSRARGFVLLVLLVLAAVSGLRSWRQVGMARRAITTCDQMDAGDFAASVQTSEGLVQAMGDGDPMLTEAARCRCLSLAALKRREECVTLADGLRARIGVTWVRDPAVALVLTEGLLSEDRAVDALEVLENAEKEHPDNLHLLGAELVVLTQKADLEAMRRLALRVSAQPSDQTTYLRISLGSALAGLGDLDAGLSAMEPSPRPDDPRWVDWFKFRALFLGNAGRQAALADNFKRWEEEGGRKTELFLYYALISDITHQQDGVVAPDEMLRAAIDHAPEDMDPQVLGQAWWRLIGHYLNSDRPERALAAYDEAALRGVMLSGVNRDELGRAGSLPSSAGRIHFRIPVYVAGDLLLVSPPPAAPADAPFESVPIDSAGSAELTRETSALPVRWVLKNAQGQAVNSGAVVVRGNSDMEVDISERKVGRTVPPFALQMAPGDGRRRVFVVVVDCGDWHLVRLLDARGELPVVHALEAAGLVGVTSSVPAFTGAAMEKLAHPRIHQGESFLGFLHHLGVELAGLESIGSNPLEGLSWVLPESPYLVDVVGASNKVAANLLFAVGDIDAGRDMVVVGPGGRTEKLTVRRRRPLTEAETAALPGLVLVGDAVNTGHLEGLAAQMDLAVSLAREKRLDLLLLRLAQTDLMTHRQFAVLNKTAMDNADNLLLWAYQYVDQRLGEVANALDQDDVLIVMSDHGIQTSMLHSPEAVFVMIGAGKGHLVGRPEIAGLPLLVAQLLGVPSPPGWPDTGLLGAAQGGGASTSR